MVEAFGFQWKDIMRCPGVSRIQLLCPGDGWSGERGVRGFPNPVVSVF